MKGSLWVRCRCNMNPSASLSYVSATTPFGLDWSLPAKEERDADILLLTAVVMFRWTHFSVGQSSWMERPPAIMCRRELFTWIGTHIPLVYWRGESYELVIGCPQCNRRMRIKPSAIHGSPASIILFYFSKNIWCVTHSPSLLPLSICFKNNSKRTPVNTTTHKRHMPMVSRRRSVPSTFPPKEWTLNS